MNQKWTNRRIRASIVGLVGLVLASWPGLIGPAVAQAPGTAKARDLEAGIRSLAESIATNLEAGSIKKLAVLEFPDINGYPSALGDFLAEEMITNLFVAAPSAGFAIVERAQLARVLSEQKLSSSALFDRASIAKVGKILGIDALVTGSIAYLGEEIKINARVISVETAAIVMADSATIVKGPVAESLLSQRSSSAGSTSRGGAAVAQPQRHDAVFQNQFLRADVRSIGKSSDGKTITLALDLTNTLSTPITIAIDQSYTDCRLLLISDRGESIQPDRGGRGVSGLPCLYGPYQASQENYSGLAPGSRTTLVLAFRVRTEIEGSVFSFAGSLLKWDGEAPEKFSIGIANIELPPPQKGDEE